MNELFKKRRSIRQYTSEPVNDRQIRSILAAAMVAPSANSLHPVEFVVVKSRVKLSKLSQCGPWQKFIGGAPIAIVILADPGQSKYWLVDASIAGAHIYLETANQGLATCWANVYQGKTQTGADREEFVRRILAIPPSKRILGIFPIGYPAQDPPQHTEAEYDQDKVCWV
ncbi:MAG: nitroreductase family protein [Candidatus Pacebacteria bacterium]|nr:nitroreductase family protein [Candidatus Paceibacterota bacterium]